MEIFDIVNIDETNIEREGCYCLRSKPAGFIEDTPIEYSSRVVYGENYIVIHCLWVNITGKGYTSKLI